MDAQYDLLGRNNIFDNVWDAGGNWMWKLAGQLVYYDSDLVVKKVVQINYNVVSAQPNIAKINALRGQNLFDLVLMTYGSLDYWKDFIAQNKITNIAADYNGKQFQWIFNNAQVQVRNQYNSVNNIVYSTAELATLANLGDFNNDFNNDFFN